MASELLKLGFVVHCYREYELEVKEQENKVLQCQKQVLEYDNTNLDNKSNEGFDPKGHNV